MAKRMGMGVMHAKPETLPAKKGMGSGGKGVQHSKPMARAKIKPQGVGHGKGVEHAKAETLPPRRHDWMDANGGMWAGRGSMKGPMGMDDRDRERGRDDV